MSSFADQMQVDVEMVFQLSINNTTTTIMESAAFRLEDTFMQFSGTEAEPSDWDSLMMPPFSFHPPQPTVPFLLLLEPFPIFLKPSTSDTTWTALRVDFEYCEPGGPFRRPSPTEPLSAHKSYGLRISVSGPRDALAQAIHDIQSGGARITLWQSMQQNMDVQVLDGMEMQVRPDVEHKFTLLSREELVGFQIEVGHVQFFACSSQFNDANFYLSVVSADNRILFSSRETPFKTIPGQS